MCVCTPPPLRHVTIHVDRPFHPHSPHPPAQAAKECPKHWTIRPKFSMAEEEEYTIPTMENFPYNAYALDRSAPDRLPPVPRPTRLTQRPASFVR